MCTINLSDCKLRYHHPVVFHTGNLCCLIVSQSDDHVPGHHAMNNSDNNFPVRSLQVEFIAF